MKAPKHLLDVVPKAGLVSLLLIPHSGSAAEASAPTNAPTGLYVSVTEVPDRFIVRLSTNSEYEVHTALLTNCQQGHWKWDDKRREFSLTPSTNTNSFGWEFRRLRVDPRQPDTLEWVPVGGIGRSRGAIDYIRFKRKNE